MGVINRKPNGKRAIKAIIALLTLACALLVLPSSSSENTVYASIDFTKSRTQWRNSGYDPDTSILDDWQSLLQRIEPLDDKDSGN